MERDWKRSNFDTMVKNAKNVQTWGDAKKCFHPLAKIQLLTTLQILYNVLPVRRCLWVGRETFAAILRHFIIARLVELGIILNANPDFNTGIFTSYLVYTLEVSDGRFRDYRQGMCSGPSSARKYKLQQETPQQGVTVYFSKGGDRWKVSGHTSVM